MFMDDSAQPPTTRIPGPEGELPCWVKYSFTPQAGSDALDPRSLNSRPATPDEIAAQVTIIEQLNDFGQELFGVPGAHKRDRMGLARDVDDASDAGAAAATSRVSSAGRHSGK
jgi:hypothetical protein